MRLPLFAAAVIACACLVRAGTVTLSWQDNSTNETDWRIERSPDGSQCLELATMATATEEATGGRVSYVDTSAPVGAPVHYRVRAHNLAGFSAYSESASITLPAPLPVPGAPAEMRITIPGVLVNISTRGVLPVSDEPMIAGFVVKDGPARVLIRGVGPELSRFGVPSPQPDPVMVLFRGQDEVLTADDWSGADIVQAGQAVHAFGLTSGSRSAAMVLTLQPGQYTVHLSGKAGSAGNALVEVYQLP